MDDEPKNLRSACAALLACGVGCATVGVLYLLGDKYPGWNRLLSLNASVGALSGVLCGAVLAWVISWIVFFLYWRNRVPSTKTVVRIALSLLLAGVLLTFPPFVRLFR